MNPQTQPQQQTETFQHYQVLRREDGSLWELGRGAMGVTYKAIDTNLRSLVALKVINTLYLDSDLARQRFLREAKAAASLRHRNVANVYHLGDDGQSFFYSMEFVDGETVHSLVDRLGPLPPVEALAITLQVARALGAACKQNLVHRDIKPANLMVVKEDDDDDASIVKVIDFGLARMSSGTGEQSAHLTMGGFVGTPQFASPEQLEEQALDTRSDIYSLGITLWYMLAGRPPFTGSLFRISSQHLSKEPPWEQLEHVPQPVKALLAHMLQKDPANRPQSPTKLRLEIEACRRELEATAPVETLPPPVKAFEPTPESISDASVSTASIVSATDAGVAAVAGPPPSVGALLGGRFFLTRLAGEGSSGTVFQARDDWSGGRTVALKTFHPEIGLHTQEFYSLQSDLGRLQAHPHPHLLEVFSLQQIEGHKFSVTEWVRGFSVVDLLRARGRLTLREAMSLLAQASDAAAHAAANHLHQLELDPHQILVNFPNDFGFETGSSDESLAIAKLQHASLVQWPEFGLKIDALAPAREDAAQVTWAGDMGAMTVSTPRLPARDTQSSIRGLIEGSYLYSLAALTYELLSGAPPPPGSNRNLAALPALSEEGNQVLRRALLPNPGFSGEREFFEMLLLASGLRRDQLLFAPRGAHPSTVAAPLVNEPEADGSETMFHDEISGGSPAEGPTPVEMRDGQTHAPPLPVSDGSDTSAPPSEPFLELPEAVDFPAPLADPASTQPPPIDSTPALTEQPMAPAAEPLVPPTRDSALISLSLPESAPVVASAPPATMADAVKSLPAFVAPVEEQKLARQPPAPVTVPVAPLPKFDSGAQAETETPIPIPPRRSPVLLIVAVVAALAVAGGIGAVALHKLQPNPRSGVEKPNVPVQPVPGKTYPTPAPSPIHVVFSTPAPTPELIHASATPPFKVAETPNSSHLPTSRPPTVPEPTATPPEKPPIAEVRQTPAPDMPPKTVIPPVQPGVTPQPTAAEKAIAASTPKPIIKKNGKKSADPAPDSTAARIQAILEAAKAGGAQAGVDTSEAAKRGAMQAAPMQADKIKKMAGGKNKNP